MNYFTAGIYGDLKLYKRLKELVRDEDDKLWIVGDIFDGSSNNPEDCIEILMDITCSHNIFLILGDHEYYHVMRILAKDKGDEKSEERWKNMLLYNEISGKPLMEYIDSLPEDDIKEIVQMLCQSEVSIMINIGNHLFYICHGAPSIRKGEAGIMIWQYEVASRDIDMSNDYIPEMGSDPKIDTYSSMFGSLDFRKVILITGHTGPEIFEDEGVLKFEDAFYYERRKFCLSTEHTADDEDGDTVPWSVLAIDAAGYFVQKI